MAWVSGAFYVVVSWLMAYLKKTYKYTALTYRGIIIVSLIFNAFGLLSMGVAFDKGMRAIYANFLVVIVGAGMGFGIFYGVGESVAASYCLTSLMHFVIGMAMAIVVLPCTRIYAPLERTTGFSFAYNCGYGVLGGTSPLIVTSIQADLAKDLKVFAPAFWLLALGGLSMIGCVMLRYYAPRLNKRFVGHLE